VVHPLSESRERASAVAQWVGRGGRAAAARAESRAHEWASGREQE
jgi:hypothetical protein